MPLAHTETQSGARLSGSLVLVCDEYLLKLEDKNRSVCGYLKEGFEKGNQLKIYGHSRGGVAAVRIANKHGAMIHISEIILYDPVGMYGGGDFVFNYPNVMKVTNYYPRSRRYVDNDRTEIFSVPAKRLAKNRSTKPRSNVRFCIF